MARAFEGAREAICRNYDIPDTQEWTASFFLRLQASSLGAWFKSFLHPE